MSTALLSMPVRQTAIGLMQGVRAAIPKTHPLKAEFATLRERDRARGARPHPAADELSGRAVVSVRRARSDAEVARMQRAWEKYRDASGRGTFKSFCLSLLQERDSRTFPDLIR
jgi:hypothetical protein